MELKTRWGLGIGLVLVLVVAAATAGGLGPILGGVIGGSDGGAPLVPCGNATLDFTDGCNVIFLLNGMS